MTNPPFSKFMRGKGHVSVTDLHYLRSHRRRTDEIPGLNYLPSPRNPSDHILENLNVHKSYN
jgi:hypothetical protein